MKERTKQWNWPITRVFDFYYTDFQPEVTRTKIIPLVELQQRTAIFYAQIKPSIIFAGTGITSAMLYLADTDAAFPLSNLSASFIKYSLTFPVSPTHGAGGSVPVRELPSHPGSEEIILNHEQSAPLFLVLQLNNGASIDNLSAGAGTVWFSYIRLR